MFFVINFLKLMFSKRSLLQPTVQKADNTKKLNSGQISNIFLSFPSQLRSARTH
jgi:hypothetical protein